MGQTHERSHGWQVDILPCQECCKHRCRVPGSCRYQQPTLLLQVKNAHESNDDEEVIGACADFAQTPSPEPQSDCGKSQSAHDAARDDKVRRTIEHLCKKSETQLIANEEVEFVLQELWVSGLFI